MSDKASQEVKSLFNDLMDLDFIFLRLQQIYSKILYDRQSSIWFKTEDMTISRQDL